MTYNYKIGDTDITIDKVSADSNNWSVIQQQSFKIDKKSFILNKFNEDYSGFDVTEYDEVENICNSSNYLREWYAKTSLLYAQTIQLPVFIKDLVSAPHYEQIQDKLLQHNKIITEQSSKIEALSRKFRQDRIDIEKQYSKKLDEFYNNKILYILTLTVEHLPILMQLEINRFVPADSSGVPNRRTYARELLLNYQRTLIKLVIDDPEIDIKAIVREVGTK